MRERRGIFSTTGVLFFLQSTTCTCPHFCLTNAMRHFSCKSIQIANLDKSERIFYYSVPLFFFTNVSRRRLLNKSGVKLFLDNL